MELAVALLALLVAVAALVDGQLQRRARQLDRTRRSRNVPPDLESLRDEVEALRADAMETFRHMSAVRYDAFGDMGGHMSWSLALLDDGGNGIVLTSIHGRSDSRTYVKNIAGWSCDQQLSPEEAESISLAREGSGH